MSYTGQRLNTYCQKLALHAQLTALTLLPFRLLCQQYPRPTFSDIERHRAQVKGKPRVPKTRGPEMC